MVMPSSTDTTIEKFEAILTDPTASPEAREKAKACVAEYTASYKWCMARDNDIVVAGMFARHRMGCVEAGIGPLHSLPKDDRNA
jgi:hypothetical protein